MASGSKNLKVTDNEKQNDTERKLDFGGGTKQNKQKKKALD